MIRIETVKNDEIVRLSELAHEIWHECFKKLLSFDQIEYMTNKFLSSTAIKENIKNGYIYRLLKDDDKMIGFTASIKEEKRIFLSKLYLRAEYRHQGLGRMMFNDVASLYDLNEIYLTVNKYNDALELYKHLGFKIIDDVVTDIGNGYVMDDYIMSLKIDR